MNELIAGILLIFVLVVGAQFIKSSACTHKSVSFEAHKYTMIGGCMVKHKGQWLPLENIRGFD